MYLRGSSMEKRLGNAALNGFKVSELNSELAQTRMYDQ
jgi:hypothetical protein